MYTYPGSLMATAMLIEWFARQARQCDELGAPTPQSVHAYEQIRLYMEDQLLVFIRYQANLSTYAAKLVVIDLFDDVWKHIQEQPADRLFYYWMFEKASRRMQSRYIYRFPQDSNHRQFRRQKYPSRFLSHRRSPSNPASSEQENLTLSLLHCLPIRQCQCLLLQDKLDFSEEDIVQVFGVSKNAVRQTLTIARCRFRLLHLQRERSPRHI